MEGISVHEARRDLPASGFAGLKHWRDDLAAGIQVALLWTPFSLGVAIASGAPAVAGLISAIVAGLLYPFLGGSHVTVSGPAAALAPVLLWGMLMLGEGDLAKGYPLVLVAIVLTGVLQIILSLLRAGQYASMLPSTVIEAMLAAIGVMIIVRQLPPLLGAPSVPTKGVLDALAKLPEQLVQADLIVAAIGLASLALMFALRNPRQMWLRRLPSAILVALFGIVAAYAAGLDARFLIKMPTNFLEGFRMPAFDQALSAPELWLPMLLVVFVFTMIDGVESVASVKAVDKIDPWRRKSDANKTLRAMGICNLTSGMLGGLTVIPNAVPSRANIDAGARTLWSNFWSGVLLVLFAVALPWLLARIPLAAIAGILIYIGWRLCEPALIRRMYSIGLDRFVVFIGTLAAILATDLLVGMLIGVAIELTLLVYLLMPSVRYVLTGRLDWASSNRLLWENFSGMFRSPVIRERLETRSGRPHATFTMRSLVGFNLLQLQKRIAALPPGAGLTLHFTESARIIDHTAVEYLRELEEEFAAEGRPFAIEGEENFFRFSAHPLASRMQEPKLARQQADLSERARLLAGFAARHGLAFRAETVATINRHGFIYLQRGAQREEAHVASGPWQGGTLRVSDYSHTSPPDYHLAHRHTLFVFEYPAGENGFGPAALTPGHYLERYLVQLPEVNSAALPEGYRAYGEADALERLLSESVRQAIATLGAVYIEWQPSAILLFRPFVALENEEAIEALLAAFAQVVCVARAARAEASRIQADASSSVEQSLAVR
ncbi:MAG: SulP family inorganic anion transporter [Casimicrobiaceae bacterium]|nr:SulP family inorganic anion transporter [Casimicrobiaceae bacterium]